MENEIVENAFTLSLDNATQTELGMCLTSQTMVSDIIVGEPGRVKVGPEAPYIVRSPNY
jgi:hypothetical protein